MVTGSAGFIGGHLAAELEQQGWEVECIDINNCDISDFRNTFEITAVDVVFHLAAFTGVRASVEMPRLCQRWNVLGTQNILERAVDLGIKHVVFASSSSVYGNGATRFLEEQEMRPMSPYAASKVAGEALCHAYHKLYGMDIAVLRYFTVYGPNGREDMAVGKFLRALREDSPITIYGDGQQKRDFTYVGDVVKATIAAAAWPGYNVVNVGYGSPHSVINMLGMLEELTGKKAEIEWAPRNPADVPVTWANTDKLCRLMDWKPTPLREGLRITVGG